MCAAQNCCCIFARITNKLSRHHITTTHGTFITIPRTVLPSLISIARALLITQALQRVDLLVRGRGLEVPLAALTPTGGQVDGSCAEFAAVSSRVSEIPRSVALFCIQEDTEEGRKGGCEGRGRGQMKRTGSRDWGDRAEGKRRANGLHVTGGTRPSGQRTFFSCLTP